jgi:hypothetical protein
VNRHVTRLVTALTVTAAALLLTAPSALAADAPTPLMPMTGLNSLLVETPDDPPGEVGPGTSFFEVYGPAGQFITPPAGGVTGAVDAVTGGAVSAGQEAASGQTFANWLMLIPEWGTAATASLAGAVFNTGSWLALLDPVWETVGGALRDTITAPFAPIVAVLLLLVLSWAILRGSIGTLVGTLGVAAAAAALITLGGNYPAQAGAAADDIITSSSTSIRDGINGTTSDDPAAALIGGLSDRITYDAWCTGMLGSKDTPTATQWCPKLYDATHFTWAEAERVRGDKDATQGLIDSKADEWNQAVKAVQDEDHDAYEFLQGNRGSSRVGVAATAVVAWFVAFPMILVSLILVVAAFFLIRVIVVFLPVLGLVMVFPRFHHLLPTIGATVAAAVINSVIFSAVASVNALVVTRIMASDLPFGVRLVVAAAFTIIAWVTTKPFRKLTRMVSNWDPTQEFSALGDKLAGALRGVTQTAIGAAAGVKLSGVDGGDSNDGASEHREPRPYRQYTPRPDYVPVTHELTPGQPAHALEGRVLNVGDISAAPVSEPAGTIAAAPVLLALPASTTPEEDPIHDDIVIIGGKRPRYDKDAGDGETTLVYDTELGLVRYRNGRPVDED